MQQICIAFAFFTIGYAVSYIITINVIIPVNFVRLKPNIFGHDINDPGDAELYISCHSKDNNHVSYCHGYSDAVIQLACQKGLGNCYDISPEKITDKMTDTKFSTRG
ncbi:hypothetical protein ARAF_0773 [Arsenophonus endosymbiont of Aleurodicus floccissimus]|nr:hypothetical protein ARAF_0773 [Arsenophonus endosymbiont of Aleurodicus floccissimus]